MQGGCNLDGCCFLASMVGSSGVDYEVAAQCDAGGGRWVGGGTQIVEMLQTKLVLTGGARTQVRVRLRAGRRDARRHPHNRHGLCRGS